MKRLTYLCAFCVFCLMLAGCSFSFGNIPEDEEPEAHDRVEPGETATPDASMNTFTDEQLGFSISYPEEWIYETGENLVIFSGAENSDDYFTTINIQNLLWGEIYHDFYDFYEDYRQQISQAGGSVSELSEANVAQGGHDFNIVEFTAEYEMEGEAFRQWVVGLDRGDGIFHQFSYTAPLDLYHRNYQVAEEMFASLTMKNLEDGAQKVDREEEEVEDPAVSTENEIEDWLWKDRDYIVNLLGPPDEELEHHSMEMIYREHLLMVFYDGENPEQPVTGVSLFRGSNYEFLGTGIGMSLGQIQDRLGDPQDAGYDEKSDKYLVMYRIDELEIYYYAENEGALVEQISVFDRAH